MGDENGDNLSSDDGILCTNCACAFFQGAKILQASHFDYEYVLGHKIAFLCVAKGNPRPQITWLKDGVEIYQHLYMHVSRRIVLALKRILI